MTAPRPARPEPTRLTAAQQDAFWELLGTDPAIAAERIRSTPVSLLTFGAVDRAAFATALEACGLSLDSAAPRTVIIAENYLDEGLDRFNRDAIRQERQWLLIKSSGTSLWLGPGFVPGTTACWACMAHRLAGHRKLERSPEGATK